MGPNTLILLALLPGILIVIYIYKKDTVEKEPWNLIFKLLVFGAISCVPASFMESFIDSAMPDYPEGSLPYALSMAFVSAAFCEELCKYLFLRFGAWRHPAFGYRFDAIVYGVAVAAGFAILENVLYVMQGGFYTALMRGVMAVPLHCFCGVFMGIFFGAAKQASVKGRSSAKYTLAALLVPMLIHGIYDTLAFLGNYIATIILLAFVLVLYIISIRAVRQYSRDDWMNGFYPEGEHFSGNGQDPLQEKLYRDDEYGAGPSGGAGRRIHPGEEYGGYVILVCPKCRTGLRVPAGSGKVRVRCPRCGTEFDSRT